MQWISTITTLIGLWLALTVWSLIINYRHARSSKFPIYISPVNPQNFVWRIFSVPLRPILARLLPRPLFDRINVAIYGWEFHGRYAFHAKVGSSFMYVTSGRNELWVADPEIAYAILTRRKDFVQMDVANEVMGMFGPNIITADGDDWQRQRKLIAPNLNENISAVVWQESVQQSQQMLSYFVTNGDGETNKSIPGIRTLAINVLRSAAYGDYQSWTQDNVSVQSEDKMSYVDALAAIANQLVLAVLIPHWLLSLPVMPEWIRQLGRAMTVFPAQAKHMLHEAKKSGQATHQSHRNMISTLIQVANQHRDSSTTDLKGQQSLTEREVIGNLFQFTIAGYDTTANTTAYAIALLVAYPEWQDWIIEEIDRVLPGHSLEDYAGLYPKCVRCLALMYEVVRLYTPVMHLSRQTNETQVISSPSRTYSVPANTLIFINGSGLHTDPKTWGPDALKFRPTRWLASESRSTDLDSLVSMPRGTFVPWSGGPRVCPGQKMAQVEFVAIMVTTFSRYRVGPVVLKGETMEMARDRLKQVIADSQPRVTLQMNRPQDVNLKWTTR